MTTDPAPVVDLRHVVEIATTAPSVHNSQPWAFVETDGGLDLYRDAARTLAVIDPDGRQSALSCGAALLQARLAVRAAGRACAVTLLPDPDRPDLLARLRVGEPEPPSPAEARLAAAIAHRHTHRGPFEPREVPAEVAAEFYQADTEGAWVRPVRPGEELAALGVLLEHADRLERADPAYRAELAAWLRDVGGPAAVDGVRTEPAPAAARGTSLTQRAFTADAARAEPADGRPAAVTDADAAPPVPERPLVLVVGSDDDGPAGWLRAGQTLAYVLLLAAAEGLQASPLGQVTDLSGYREALRRALGLIGHPQLVLRLGYASEGPSTGRRPVDEVLRTGG